MWMGYSCVLLEDNLNEKDRRGLICHNFRILMGQGDYCNEMFYRPTMGYWDSGMIVTTKNSCLVTQWEFHGMLWGLIFNVCFCWQWHSIFFEDFGSNYQCVEILANDFQTVPNIAKSDSGATSLHRHLGISWSMIFPSYTVLLGGLEHVFMTFHSVGNVIIPTVTHSIIFQRGW